MQEYIVKENTALMFFAVKGMDIPDKQKELLVWTKLFDSFHYDEDAVVNLIYINHPLESYFGCSVRTKPDLIPEKIKRYSEGLAYLLVYYFPQADIRVLSQDECLGIVANLANFRNIPRNLCVFDGQYMLGEHDVMSVLFARNVDPQLILDKFYEFYKEYQLQKNSTLETRIGTKPKCDPRMLQILEHAYLAYCFRFVNLIKPINAADCEPDKVKTMDFLKPFFEFMGVPDIFVQKIAEAKNTVDLFDDPELILVPPEVVAEFALGYK